MSPLDPDPHSHAVIGAAIKVHRKLGPGLLESVYVACLAYELRQLGLAVECEVPIPVRYDNLTFDMGFRADLVVENALVIEAKAVERIPPVYMSKLRTYLAMSGLKVGLLINFNVEVLRDGISRSVHRL